MTDDWLSSAETGRKLGLSERTVRRMAAAGRLPAYRFGLAYRVDPDELRQYIAKSRMDSGDAAGVVAGGNQDNTLSKAS